VLDWIEEAFAETPAHFLFVGGYNLEQVARRYPGWTFAVNADWERSGPTGSLFAAPLTEGRRHFVSYTDVVYRRDLVERLWAAEEDVVLAVDSRWEERYEDRPAADLARAERLSLDGGPPVEFAGLMLLSPRAVSALRAVREQEAETLRGRSLPDLLERLRSEDLSWATVDARGDWAELNAPQDLAHFVLGTKAQTLERLRPLVRRCEIGATVRIAAGDWRRDRAAEIGRIAAELGDARLAVRSSARHEDAWTASLAGAYLSVLDVPGTDEQAVADAVDRVIASFDGEDPADEVLVQRMVPDVALSGVALTRTLARGGPYRVVSYDDSSTLTDTVTGGTSADDTTFVVHRSRLDVPAGVNPLLAGFPGVLVELEELAGHDSLDVEFAVTQGGQTHVLQLRPIAVDHGRWKGADDDVERMIEQAEGLFERRDAAPGAALGSRAVFGVMPDWNPAEIIGTRPRRLALSLYRHLVTDEVWATQRAEYGYRDLRPGPLLWVFAGHPYVDVRASLTSFVPAAVPDALAERLVEHGLARLREQPALHDKLEFALALTCLTPDFDARAEALRTEGWDDPEIGVLRDALREVTVAGIERLPRDVADSEAFAARTAELTRIADPLDRAFALLDDCRRAGTLPFAHLARGAFVAVSLLRSFVERRLLPEDHVESFMHSLHTIASQLAHDAWAVSAGDLEWDELVARYGHLRPGTYDITAPSYAAEPERYLRPLVEQAVRPEHEPVPLAPTPDAAEGIRSALAEAGLPGDVAAIERFVRDAIEGRERAKFLFTRNVSLALDALAEAGAAVGLDAGLVADLSIHELGEARAGGTWPDLGARLRDQALSGRDWHRLAQSIELPPLVTSPDELRAFVRMRDEPSFVGTGDVTAPVHRPGGEAAVPEGAIVVVAQADPGWDWLFGQRIAGLVTAYGGANSHMAIRAAEFGLPAAIGVGEAAFERLAAARVLHLDCAHRRIEAVR
jgi:choline kinase